PLLEAVSAVPEVAGASAIHIAPGRPFNWAFNVYPEGHEYADREVRETANFRAVWPDYFETARIELVGGRTFGWADRHDSEPVVIVNRAFAERWWPGETAVDRQLRLSSTTARPHRIVGIVDDVRQFGFGRAPVPEVYYLHEQWGSATGQTLVVRFTDGDAVAHAGGVRDAIHAFDPLVVVEDVESMASILGASAATTRFLAFVLTLFGGFALALGAVGVFGVTAFSIGRRMPEFGVRMALGSSRQGVVGAALLHAARPVVLGLLIGLVLAVGTGRLLESALYQVEPSDPITLVAVAAVLLSVSTAAVLGPVLRAGAVDLVRVLSRS
ncbi:MAG: ABC transporter permease, partial [Gemmatimonadota bacterium]